jgi:hypothetical protein
VQQLSRQCARVSLPHSATVNLLAIAASLASCHSLEKSLAPSNIREWQADQALLPYGQFHGEFVTIRNVRNCRYLNDDIFVVDHFDKTYDLASLRTVDFIVCPFSEMPILAHTMLSFGFQQADGSRDYLALSVEVRKEQGEDYAVWRGMTRQYELMYVLADERDVIALRTNHRGEDVYLYRTTATPEQGRHLLVDVIRRANKLALEPEFYDALTNNCTTNIVHHINRLFPGRIPPDHRILFPGCSAQLAYELGLLEKHGTFEETERQAHVNARAEQLADRADFSEQIRRF